MFSVYQKELFCKEPRNFMPLELDLFYIDTIYYYQSLCSVVLSKLVCRDTQVF